MKSQLKYPQIKINLAKIIHNARRIVEASKRLKIGIVGVTKSCQGDPAIAKAMVEGGACQIADSRIPNLEKLHKAGFSNLLMLRQPLKNEVDEVIQLTQARLVSDLAILKLLSRAAARENKRYKVILMVETGELREGITPEEVPGFVASTLRLPNIEIWGIGTNFACFSKKDMTSSGGKLSARNLLLLCKVAEELRSKLGYYPSVISGGNSSAWRLVETIDIPPQINQLRMGEAILLGQETLFYQPIANTFQDVFIFESEAMEVREKPLNLFDEKRAGTRKQVLVALGKQDIGAGCLTPCSSSLEVLRVSSDHLVLGVGAELDIKVGDILSFKPDYQALVGAMMSSFVQKVYLTESGGDIPALSNIETKIC